MNTITTTNPYTGEKIDQYSLHSSEAVLKILDRSNSVFYEWSKTSVNQRASLLKNLSNLFVERIEPLSQLMTLEMGKPISQSKAEIEKCVWVCDFYAKNAASFLSDAIIETDAEESFISYDPIGTVLAIMPWNYPFWQVMRFAAPTLTAGNTALLKHAANVTGCALAIEKLFLDAGYPEGCFQVVLADHDQIEKVIENDTVKAVSLTGSEKAGRAIAEIAGKNLKKSVLELGGSNACIVWEDADIDAHIETMVKARMQNTGQSCIAAKRFIVVASIYERFLESFQSAVKKLKTGDPMNDDTYIGVMARTDLADTLEEQVSKSVKEGAKVVLGNKREGTFYEPTILTEVTKDMPVFKEETFGPVASVIKVKNREESLEMAAHSSFGLGSMIFTEDIKAARQAIPKIPDGAFFVNDMVKSDPRLPFGGTKASGYGRELSKEGILEFVNKKTVYIK